MTARNKIKEISLFIVIFALFLPSAFAFQKDDEVICIEIAEKSDSTFSITVAKLAYDHYMTDEEFRSRSKTDLRVFVKDSDGKKLGSSHLKMRKVVPGIGLSSSQKAGSQPAARLIRYAKFNFKFSEKAYQVDLFNKGKVVASVKLEDALKSNVSLQPKRGNLSF